MCGARGGCSRRADVVAAAFAAARIAAAARVDASSSAAAARLRMSVRGETSAPPLARWAARVRVGEGEIRVVAARGVAREDGKSMSSWTAAVVGLGSSASSSARGARAGLGLAPRLSRSRLAADAAWAMPARRSRRRAGARGRVHVLGDARAPPRRRARSSRHPPGAAEASAPRPCAGGCLVPSRELENVVVVFARGRKFQNFAGLVPSVPVVTRSLLGAR